MRHKHLLPLLLGPQLLQSAQAVGAAALSPYSDDVSRRLAVLSSIAYAPNDQIGNWTFPNPACALDGFQVKGTYAVEPKSAYGFVGIDHQLKAIVASYQGTSDKVDWITDLSTWLHYNFQCIVGDTTNTTALAGGHGSAHGDPPAAVSLGYVHFGFCKYYKSLAEVGMTDALVALAQARRHRDYSIVLTGHSLGAAAATLAAADLAVRYQVPRERLHLYSFGAPRPGDAGFAALLNDSVGTAYRVVHNRDIVPHLAPCCRTWKAGCGTLKTCPFHAATQVWYNNDMDPGQNFSVCNQEDQICDQVVNLSVNDHQVYFGFNVGGFCGEVNTTAGYLAAVEQAQAEQDALARNGALARAEASLAVEHGLYVGGGSAYAEVE